MQTTVPSWAPRSSDTTSAVAPDPAPPSDQHAPLPGPPGPPAGGGGNRPRWKRFVLGPDSDPAWARPGLILLLVATTGFYTYNLTSSGWANSFYSAAVQAGSESWKAFFFGSSDAANSITVDKTPAALWVMALSVRVFGLSSFSILFPQVLMGVATVWLVHASVKRYVTAAAGLIAGLVMALTPVAVLMFRFNNPDALLVLLMTAATALTLRACEHGRGRLLVLAGVLLGLGFLTKMLQVFLVLPALALVYLLVANTSLSKRLLHGVTAVAALVVTAGWWIAIVELVPASMRPYIGGSQNNSILELTLGYNGLGRLNGEETGSVGGGGGWGTTGIGRMFSSAIGGQISWLLPTALLLLGVGLILRGRRPRTDLRRGAYLAWGGWLLVTGITFSFMAGIFHEYYTVALAPAIAALVGMGAVEAWEHRDRLIGSITLSAALALAAGWSFVLLARTTAYPSALRWTVLVVGLLVAFGLLFAGQLPRRIAGALVVAAVLVGLAGPTAYSVTTVSTAHTGSIVTAGPSTGRGGMAAGGGRTPGGGQQAGTAPNGAASPPPGGTMQGGGTQGATQGGGPQGFGGGMGGGGLLDADAPSAELVEALTTDADQFTWVAAAVGSQSAAVLQLGTGEPVMAIGGFNGSDPSPTLDQFQEYVANGEIHYVVAGGRGGGMGASAGGSNASSEISTWVQENFTSVTIGGTTLYDLTQPIAGADA